MGLPAARVGDPHLCPMFDGPKPHVGGPVLPLGAVPNVWIGGMMAATMGTMCTCASVPDSIMMGSPTVYIGGRMAARMLDPTVHGGRILFGCLNVWIGDSGAPSSLASFFSGLLNGLFDGLKAIVEPLTWFATAAVQGFVSALKETISTVVSLAKEILADPLKVLQRTANFLQKLDPAYWVAKLITDPQTRADLGQWLSDHAKKETWVRYGDVAKKAYDTWQQLTPKEKWTAAGDLTGRAIEFAAEIVVLDGATKALGAVGEVAKGEEVVAGLGELGKSEGVIANVTKTAEAVEDVTFNEFKLSVDDFSKLENESLAKQSYDLYKDRKFNELEKLFKENRLNEKNGVIWPPNNGAIGKPIKKVIQPGTKVDRYGSLGTKGDRKAGRFASPSETPLSQRALPPDPKRLPPSGFVVKKPVHVWEAEVMPWFEQEGKGVQQMFPVSVDKLIRKGFLQ